jgi:hypothetical protein
VTVYERDYARLVRDLTAERDTLKVREAVAREALLTIQKNALSHEAAVMSVREFKTWLGPFVSAALAKMKALS